MTRPPAKTRPAVDGAALLDRVHATIARYCVLPCPEAVDAVTLWIAATHAQEAWAYAPRLIIRAPLRRCGKSRLLDVVEAACHNPMMSVNASPAAIYRTVGMGSTMTLLLDEFDAIFGAKASGDEDLRGLLNAGHQRGRPVSRYDAGTQRVEHIETFCMVAMAGIGLAPETIEDRAVIVKMRRRAAGETVKPWRLRRDRPIITGLATELREWLAPHLAELETAEPVMPLEDRAADTWEPLIVIADFAAGDWPERARAAAVLLSEEADRVATNSDSGRLLADIRNAFGTEEALPTAGLLAKLRADDEAPWATWDKTGLTPIRLAAMLREYDIRSSNIRFPAPLGQTKGYRRADFTDAWSRYCPETTDSDDNGEWDGSSRPTQDPVPGVSSVGTGGTGGTGTPLPLRLIHSR
ncbi:DUF3631 domain-containing protein [Catellatospora citrea]|uniref:DUF3631 domain-containing protein n=2 Tax=Catellatospora citrea TaxID=53366 RepID=A0A8J3P3P1_9ACTN|nr:DUF3631 domain-containing protein [Catellatospora citrea]RKE08377.1 uncharacterized protein DUF3631 [Catellatospora citrea]GIG02524.1 hypothetical protein Cci01nite_76170 [Catellatospora citrea]